MIASDLAIILLLKLISFCVKLTSEDYVKILNDNFSSHYSEKKVTILFLFLFGIGFLNLII